MIDFGRLSYQTVYRNRSGRSGFGPETGKSFRKSSVQGPAEVYDRNRNRSKKLIQKNMKTGRKTGNRKKRKNRRSNRQNRSGFRPDTPSDQQHRSGEEVQRGLEKRSGFEKGFLRRCDRKNRRSNRPNRSGFRPDTGNPLVGYELARRRHHAGATFCAMFTVQQLDPT